MLAPDYFRYITGLGQLAIGSDYGVATMTAYNGFMIDSNIWQGMTDFRSALLSLAHARKCDYTVEPVALAMEGEGGDLLRVDSEQTSCD